MAFKPMKKYEKEKEPKKAPSKKVSKWKLLQNKEKEQEQLHEADPADAMEDFMEKKGK